VQELPSYGHDEDSKERIDRELIEFLNGLRVVMPGVQVLFAFLLVVPFNQRFTEITSFQRDVYFATLLCSLVAAVLLMTPTAYHRLQFRQGIKKEMLITCSHLSIAGLAFLALAMTGAVLLITDLLFSTTLAVVTTAGAAILLSGFWYVLPVVQGRHTRSNPSNDVRRSS